MFLSWLGYVVREKSKSHGFIDFVRFELITELFYLFQATIRLLRLNIISLISMNTLDPRLYHYQYRRPRLSNPTYNSNNLFDSLNMFARVDIPPSLANSYARYSLPKNEKNYASHSQTIDYRSNQATNNFSTILPPLQSPRQGLMLTDKDQKYLQSLQDKGERRRSELRSMRGSQLSENVENRSHLSYKMGDSLTKGLEEFQSARK